jgi:hypothetical protein
MDTSLPSFNDFVELLHKEIERLPSQHQREFISSRLLDPRMAQLRWEYGADEEFEAWVFADMGERNVVAQYCRGGFGARGAPWGINFFGATHFGQDCGWYSSLVELLEDWGVRE